MRKLAHKFLCWICFYLFQLFIRNIFWQESLHISLHLIIMILKMLILFFYIKFLLRNWSWRNLFYFIYGRKILSLSPNRNHNWWSLVYIFKSLFYIVRSERRWADIMFSDSQRAKLNTSSSRTKTLNSLAYLLAWINSFSAVAVLQFGSWGNQSWRHRLIVWSSHILSKRNSNSCLPIYKIGGRGN